MGVEKKVGRYKDDVALGTGPSPALPKRSLGSFPLLIAFMAVTVGLGPGPLGGLGPRLTKAQFRVIPRPDCTHGCDCRVGPWALRWAQHYQGRV